MRCVLHGLLALRFSEVPPSTHFDELQLVPYYERYPPGKEKQNKADVDVWMDELRARVHSEPTLMRLGARKQSLSYRILLFMVRIHFETLFTSRI